MTVPIAMPEDLLEEVRRAAELTHLSMADVIRQATKRGIAPLIIECRTEKLPPMAPDEIHECYEVPDPELVINFKGFGSRLPIFSRFFWGSEWIAAFPAPRAVPGVGIRQEPRPVDHRADSRIAGIAAADVRRLTFYEC
jgi:hypothetical protein